MPEPGEPQDFASVYDRYFARVFNFVRVQVDDATTADDVTSRIFERVLAGLGSYREDKGPFETWLFSVARNAVRDHFRSRRWRTFLPLDAASEPVRREPGADERLASDEDRRRLERALRKLDARKRDILALKFQAGLTNRRISEVLGLGESHVGVLIYRAIRELRTMLDAGDEPS